MFVSPDARASLRADRRDRFFADVIDPMLVEARTIGISVEDIIRHLHQSDEEKAQ